MNCATYDNTINIALLDRFLYTNDGNLIYNFLELNLSQDVLRNFHPQYRTIKNLKRRILYFLRSNSNRYFVMDAVIRSIYEDVQRLELYFYILGYHRGYLNTTIANLLEKTTIDNVDFNSLEGDYVQSDIERIIFLQRVTNFTICHDETDLKIYKDVVENFCSHFIRHRIYSLNKKIDKQLVFRMEEDFYRIEEDGILITKDVLTELYKRTVRAIYKNMIHLYEEAFWFGINDRVMKRYV